jgi:plastocyanin
LRGQGFTYLGLAGTAAAMAISATMLAQPPARVHAASTVTIQMKEFKFILPDGSDNNSTALNIHVGDTVTWTWNESATDPQPNCDAVVLQPPFPVNCPGHTTTAADKNSAGKPLWDSGICPPPDGRPKCPFAATFDKPGTFAYYCVIHGGPSPNNPLTKMNGTIVVQATGTTAPAATGAPSSTPSSPAVSVLPQTGAALPLLGLGAGAAGSALLMATARRRR